MKGPLALNWQAFPWAEYKWCRVTDGDLWHLKHKVSNAFGGWKFSMPSSHTDASILVWSRLNPACFSFLPLLPLLLLLVLLLECLKGLTELTVFLRLISAHHDFSRLTRARLSAGRYPPCSTANATLQIQTLFCSFDDNEERYEGGRRLLRSDLTHNVSSPGGMTFKPDYITLKGVLPQVCM